MWTLLFPAGSAEGRSSPRDLNITSSPQARCVNAKRCPRGAQAAKRPERVGGLGEGIRLQGEPSRGELETGPCVLLMAKPAGRGAV